MRCVSFGYISSEKVTDGGLLFCISRYTPDTEGEVFFVELNLCRFLKAVSTRRVNRV